MPRKARFLRQRQWWYKFAMPLVLVALGPSVYGVWRLETNVNRTKRVAKQNRVLAKEGVRAHAALCTVRKAEKQKLATELEVLRRSEMFLQANPNGIPGISAALIRTGIAQDKANVAFDRKTIKALGILSPCPDPKGTS